MILFYTKFFKGKNIIYTEAVRYNYSDEKLREKKMNLPLVSL